MINLGEIKAIIFDVDGLMADTEYYHMRATFEMMKNYGIKLSQKYLVGLVGFSLQENFDNIKKDFGMKESVAELIKIREKIYLATVRKSGMQAFPGLKEIFNLAKRREIKIAVGSSSAAAQLNMVLPIILGSAGIKQDPRRYFDAVVTGTDVKRTKPAPDIYKLAAKLLKVNPGNCLVLEDSPVGVKAAKAAGMKCIAVKNRHSKHLDLSKADHFAASLISVLGLLEQGLSRA